MTDAQTRSPSGGPGRFRVRVMWRHVAGLAACLAVLVGCSATAASNTAPLAVGAADPRPQPRAVSPVEGAASGSAVLMGNVESIAYADKSPSERLDLHLPPTGVGPFPLVVYVHGGAWERGDRTLAPHSSPMALVDAGFAVASVDYRMSRDAVFPAQIQDVEAAIRFLRANASKYGLDTSRIGVWGESAGGYLAALAGVASTVAAFDDALLGNETVSAQVSAVVDWYGPADLTTFDAQLATDGCSKRIAPATSAESRLIGASVSAKPDLARHASPVTYVTADSPAILIQHGKADCVVPWQQSDELAKTYAQLAGTARVTLDVFAQAGHGGSLFTDPTNVVRVVAFFLAHLARTG